MYYNTQKTPSRGQKSSGAKVLGGKSPRGQRSSGVNVWGGKSQGGKSPGGGAKVRGVNILGAKSPVTHYYIAAIHVYHFPIV